MKKKLSLIIISILVTMLLVPTSVFADEHDDNDNSLKLSNTTQFKIKIDPSELNILTVKENIENFVSLIKGEGLVYDHGDINVDLGTSSENKVKVKASAFGNGFIFSDTLKVGTKVEETIGNIKSLLPEWSISSISGKFDNDIDLDLASVVDVEKINRHLNNVVVEKISLDGCTEGKIKIELEDLGINLVDGITGVTVTGGIDNDYNLDEKEKTIEVDRHSKSVTIHTSQGSIVLALQK